MQTPISDPARSRGAPILAMATMDATALRAVATFVFQKIDIMYSNTQDYEPAGECFSCGYPSDVGKCPECGAENDAESLITSTAVSRALAWERRGFWGKLGTAPVVALTFVRLLCLDRDFPRQPATTKRPLWLLLGTMLVVSAIEIIWDVRELFTPTLLVERGVRRHTFGMAVLCMMLAFVANTVLRRNRVGQLYWRALLYGVVVVGVWHCVWFLMLSCLGWVDLGSGGIVVYSNPSAGMIGTNSDVQSLLSMIVVGLVPLVVQVFFILAAPALVAFRWWRKTR